MTTNKKSKDAITAANKSGGSADRNVRDINDPKLVTLADALTELFEGDLHPTTGASRHTAESYRTTFRLLLRFLEQDRPDLLRASTPVESPRKTRCHTHQHNRLGRKRKTRASPLAPTACRSGRWRGP